MVRVLGFTVNILKMNFLIVKTIFSLRSPSQRGYLRMLFENTITHVCCEFLPARSTFSGYPLLLSTRINFCFLSIFALSPPLLLVFPLLFGTSLVPFRVLFLRLSVLLGMIWLAFGFLLTDFFLFILCLFVCESRISLTHCCSFLRIGFHVFN